MRVKNKLGGLFSSLSAKTSALYNSANDLIKKAGDRLDDTGVPQKISAFA